MKTVRDNSLRKVAILLASLDEAASDQILAMLTPQQARSVLAEVDQLTEIDSNEQREIIAEFRRGLTRTPERAENAQSSGVELDASLLARIDRDDYAAAVPSSQRSHLPLSAEEAGFLVEMLSGESLQMVALVISRLDADVARTVLDRFSQQQQAEILHRLEQLDTTDEHSVQVVEAQVHHWLAEQRRHRERMAAGKQMVDRIVNRVGASTPSEDSTAVAAARISLASQSKIVSQVCYQPMPPVEDTPPPVNPFAVCSAEECRTRLEQLSDHELFAAMSECESCYVMPALVGVSEKLLKRIMRGMSRNDAKSFRQQLRDVGPVRLADILFAQQEILHVASQVN